MCTIRNLWNRIRKTWDDFWIGDECDDSKKHLSQTDKRFLLYGNFIIGAFTVALVLLLTGINNLQIDRKNTEDMEKVINMVTSYMASATADEYDEIAETIRHDLVLTGQSENAEKYLPYIPNTSDICRACEGSYPAQAVLVSLNTGDSYSLDLFERGIETEDYKGSTQLTFGYDEISQSSIHISKSPGENRGTAEIEHGNRIVSIHRMKRLFCDHCIESMLESVQNQSITEIVILDTENDIFYPVEDGTELQVGDYKLKTGYQNTGYEISISPVTIPN